MLLLLLIFIILSAKIVIKRIILFFLKLCLFSVDLSISHPTTPNREIYTLIGSSRITKNTDLLRYLEQKCGIVIIEREYEKILKSIATTSSKMCRQPDLILDQRASVIIENVINFGNEEGYKLIVDQVLSTSFKCQICSIILVCLDNKHSKYV